MVRLLASYFEICFMFFIFMPSKYLYFLSICLGIPEIISTFASSNLGIEPICNTRTLLTL